MENKIKNAFDDVKADDILKAKTKNAVLKMMSEETATNTRKVVSLKPLVTAAACFVFSLISVIAFSLYFTPTATISIDLNPSLELEINRFDKVLSCKGINFDGEKLLEDLHLKHLNYKDAVEAVIENEKVNALLNDGEFMTVLVVSDDDEKSDEMLSVLRHCTKDNANTQCYKTTCDDVSQAHEHGLSYGKYRAFLIIKELDPDFTEQEAQNMTMRQLKDLITSLSDGEIDIDAAIPSNSNCDGSGNNESHHQKGEHSKGDGSADRNCNSTQNGKN